MRLTHELITVEEDTIGLTIVGIREIGGLDGTFLAIKFKGNKVIIFDVDHAPVELDDLDSENIDTDDLHRFGLINGDELEYLDAIDEIGSFGLDDEAQFVLYKALKRKFSSIPIHPDRNARA